MNNERTDAKNKTAVNAAEGNGSRADNGGNAEKNAKKQQNFKKDARKDNRRDNKGRDPRERVRERDREREREREAKGKESVRPYNGAGGGNKNGGKKQNVGGRDKPNASSAADNRKDVYAYALDGNVYINLTNKCSNGCSFCVRNERASYYGNYLWLRHGDPTAEKVIAAIESLGGVNAFKEVIFCGFGEPTYKIAEMCAVADYVHAKGGVTRLNTNGQGNLVNKRDIVPALKGKIDKINISLNASCAEKYQPVCRSMFGEAGYTAILDFARLCKRGGIECWFSVVDIVGEDEVAACKRVADGVGIPLRVRKYIADS